MWHVLAEKVTHTSVATTKQIIGRAEFLDWIAYYEIKKEEEEKAIEKAKRSSNSNTTRF